MFKRLSISLLVMGLAAFGLGAAAFAWFSDSGSGQISVTAGSADLKFRVDIDCNNEAGVWDSGFFDADTTPFAFTWSDIVPGDTTAGCIEVTNDGEGELTVSVTHGDFTGISALLEATTWQYNAQGDGDGIDCPAAAPNAAQYTSGCVLDVIDEGEVFILRVDASFTDLGDQNGLEGQSFGFLSTLTGQTG